MTKVFYNCGQSQVNVFSLLAVNSVSFLNISQKMRPRRICPEKEALDFIIAENDKDTFQKRIINKEKGMLLH